MKPILSAARESSDSATLHQILYPYGIGIDTHSKFIQVCVLYPRPSESGHSTIMRHEGEFLTTWADLCKARCWAVAHLLAADLDISSGLRYCIESTGTYHMPVLRAWGGIPSVVNPLLAGPTRRKTDVLDARLLAHHSITGVWKPSFIASEQAQVLRVLWAARGEAVRVATRYSNRINNIVLRFGHTFGAQCSMRSAEGQGILADLCEGRSPKAIGVAPDGLPLAVRTRLTLLSQEMHTEVANVKKHTAATLNFIKARDWPIGTGSMPGTNLLAVLRSVPGVGEATALTWLSEVTDPTRFQDPRQVAAYAGCDPSLKVSAGKVTSMVRRAGNLRLHHALLYAAAGLLQRATEPLGAWGRSIAGRHKKGGHRKARGAIARRIAAALWQVHIRGETFSYAGYNLSAQVILPDVPLSAWLKKPALKVLAREDIKDAPALARAYTDGKLAAIHGLGEITIKEITAYICKWGRGKVANKPTRIPVASGTMSDATDAEHLARASRSLPSRSKSSSSKVYVLKPSLMHSNPRTSKKKKYDTSLT